MSDSSAHPSRPRPVVWYGMLTAALAAFLGYAGVSDLMPKAVIGWVGLAAAVLVAAGSVYVQSVTTPVSDPRDNRGVPLAPVDTVTGNAPDLPPLD